MVCKGELGEAEWLDLAAGGNQDILVHRWDQAGPLRATANADLALLQKLGFLLVKLAHFSPRFHML